MVKKCQSITSMFANPFVHTFTQAYIHTIQAYGQTYLKVYPIMATPIILKVLEEGQASTLKESIVKQSDGGVEEVRGGSLCL